jgi:hypothetical protein
MIFYATHISKQMFCGDPKWLSWKINKEKCSITNRIASSLPATIATSTVGGVFVYFLLRHFPRK